MAVFAAAALALGACGQSEQTAGTEKETGSQTTVEDKGEPKAEEKAESEEAEVDYAAVFGEALAELEKAKQGGAVDFGKVESLYKEKLQPLVQKRDAEFEDTLD